MTTTLSKLEFENFQSLRNTSLELDPHLNVIVGKSNLGKSAALRSLKALVRNAAAPGLVSQGASTMKITARFADGSSETLVKGKNKSEFHINLFEKAPILHAKAGASEVPDEVVELWGVAEPDGKRELSFATQHEPPFLLAEPASAVATTLGDLTNASLLMDAVAKCNKLRTQANSDVKARIREAEEAREEILAHKGLNARGKAIEKARAAYDEAQQALNKWNTLRTLEDSYTKLSQELTEVVELTNKSANFDKLIVKAEAAVVHFETLFNLNEQYNKLYLESKSCEAQIVVIQEAIEENEQKMHDILEELGQCPVCGQDIK